jgi:hypothetical protein
VLGSVENTFLRIVEEDTYRVYSLCGDVFQNSSFFSPSNKYSILLLSQRISRKRWSTTVHARAPLYSHIFMSCRVFGEIRLWLERRRWLVLRAQRSLSFVGYFIRQISYWYCYRKVARRLPRFSSLFLSINLWGCMDKPNIF